jgi:cellulose synthase/poly-beta-1,6-N-acetylglucosamine synthase-like glycosyltransferase
MNIILRFFEILPAASAWATLFLPIIFLKEHPNAVSVFILLYIFLWFLRAIEYAFFLVYSFRKYKKALRRDWREEVKKVAKNADILPEKVVHLIILPTYKESLEVLRESISSVAQSDFPKEQIYFCLATEERDLKNGRKNAKILQQEFRETFGRFFWQEHPMDLPEEIPGKGGNISYAAKNIEKILSSEGIPYKNVLVTTLDADNKLHPYLLSALTVAYCGNPQRHKRSFQPLPLFFNNIWEVPVINRIVALSSSFWHLIESGRPDRLRNFSSHSQPLSALVEMNYWDKTTIVEDGRQYWRSYLHFNGDYEVIPVFLPVYQDAILNKTFFRSLLGQFQQLRRWAWGSSDIAYYTCGIVKQWKKLPLLKTALQYVRLVEGHYMWATAALFLIIAPLAEYFLNPHFSQTVFGSHFSFLLSVLFKIALIGILISMVLTFLFVPAPPQKKQRFGLFWQWLFFPIATICFGCLPALFTQTQLALGQKMRFNVTEKIRKKNEGKK